MNEFKCKDCIHYCVCKNTVADDNWTDDAPIEIREMFSPKNCENFFLAAYVNRLQEENELLIARIGIYETCSARKDEAIRHLEAEIKKLKGISDNKTKELFRYNASIEELHKKLEIADGGNKNV